MKNHTESLWQVLNMQIFTWIKHCFDLPGRLEHIPFETSERQASFPAACCEEPLAALWLGEG